MNQITQNVTLLQNLASRAGSSLLTPSLINRIHGDPALDYVLEGDLQTTFRPLLDGPVASEAREGLNALIDGIIQSRRHNEREEIHQLHEEFQRQGFLLPPLFKKGIEFLLGRLRNGEPILEGGLILYSNYWGPIDLGQLNDIRNYSEGRGLIRLARDLSVVTGEREISLTTIFSRMRWTRNRELMWKNVGSIQWCRAWYLLTKVPWDQYKGAEGYQEFARRYTNGSMQSAFQRASMLLGPQKFLHLEWGRIISLSVDELEPVKVRLLAGIKDRSFVGPEGWRRFAASLRRGLVHARYDARCLLPLETYLRLGWALSPNFLALELIIDGIKEYSDEALENLKGQYPGLLQQLIGSGAGTEKIAAIALKWTWVESRFVPSRNFKKRALQILRRLTQQDFSTQRPAALSFHPTKSEFLADSSALSPEEEVIRRETKAHLAKALGKLSPQQNHLLELTSLEGMSLADAARQLGMDSEKARTEYETSLTILREVLDETDGEF